MAAAALAPRRPISEGARERALSAMMREVDRRTHPLATEHSEDLEDPGMHARVAQVGPGMEMRVADIEEIDDVRLEQIASKLAERMRRDAPDRNQ
ncbi:hypothetical protein AB0I69_42860 [Streptomyces sp. NPDC050508]|uniref:hypothetical protein n=1 Tax=Streptomyces sp. NPDC050508 TaxID=3155405 RepID=UPI003434CF91